ncbi:MAG: EF-hand domain-containing protein [Methylococcales bacterium]|nr:EF-hand domain-containing protein [Methylococcales bacterium]
MKKLLKPLIASTLLIACSSVYAQSYSADRVNKTLNIMDDNKDNKVKFDEYFEETFTDNKDSFDVNKDGYITSGEIVLEIKEDLIQTINEMRKQGVSEKNINKTIANELKTAEKEAEALIQKMDADGDNLVEPNEIKKFKQAQFDALDKNNDGALSSSDIGSAATNKAPSKGYSVVPYNPS